MRSPRTRPTRRSRGTSRRGAPDDGSQDAAGTRDEPEFDRWRAEADRALASARVQADAGLHNWACFAAEQSAQLATEALLHGLGQGPDAHPSGPAAAHYGQTDSTEAIRDAEAVLRAVDDVWRSL